jgi:spore coat protein U-like protein
MPKVRQQQPRPQPANQYQEFRYQLYSESPRAAYWLESMVYGLMAQTGVAEDTALELVCKIVAHPAKAAARWLTVSDPPKEKTAQERF